MNGILKPETEETLLHAAAAVGSLSCAKLLLEVHFFNFEDSQTFAWGSLFQLWRLSNFCLRFTFSTLKTLSSVFFCFPERSPYRCVGLVRDDDPAALCHHCSEQCCQDGELFRQICSKELYEHCISIKIKQVQFSINQPFYVLSDWWIMWRWSCCWTTALLSTPVSNEKEARFFTKASRRATSRWWRPSLKIRLDVFCKID